MASDTTTSASTSVAPPAPLSPAARKRLQQCFEYGRQKSKAGEHEGAHDWYAQCVAGDPSNLVYLEALFDNLRALYGNNRRKARLVSSRSPLKKAQSEGRWSEAFKIGADLLGEHPWDVTTLRTMAEICATLHYNEVELRYLKNALDASPKDVEVNKHCAVSLARMGQYDQAIACWHRIEHLPAMKAESARMISQLTLEKNRQAAGYTEERPSASGVAAPNAAAQTARDNPSVARASPSGSSLSLGDKPVSIESLTKAIGQDPANTKLYLALATLHEQAGELQKAESVLRRGLQASGNNLTVRERLENVQMRAAQTQLAIAEKQAAEAPSDAAKQLVEQLRKDVYRIELAIYQNRVQRYPQQWPLVYEFAVRLKRSGLFAEAIKQFEAAAVDPNFAASGLLQKGECLQQLRQYQEAFGVYQKAGQLAEVSGNAELQKLSLYRAGVLAAGLKADDHARKILKKLLELDANYRDAQARLDKLGAV